MLRLVAETYVAAAKRLQQGCCSQYEDLGPTNISTCHNLIMKSANMQKMLQKKFTRNTKGTIVETR